MFPTHHGVEFAFLSGLGEVPAELVQHQGGGALAGAAGATGTGGAGARTSTNSVIAVVGGVFGAVAAFVTGQ